MFYLIFVSQTLTHIHLIIFSPKMFRSGTIYTREPASRGRPRAVIRQQVNLPMAEDLLAVNQEQAIGRIPANQPIANELQQLLPRPEQQPPRPEHPPAQPAYQPIANELGLPSNSMGHDPQFFMAHRPISMGHPKETQFLIDFSLIIISLDIINVSSMNHLNFKQRIYQKFSDINC